MNNLEDYMNDLGFTADDLKEPEALKFTAKEPVQFYIIDVKEINREETDEKRALKALVLTTKVMTGEYEGKLFSMFINKRFKDAFVKFLRASWTIAELEEAVKAGSIDYTRLVGRTLEATPAAAKEVGDKVYQNFYDYKTVTDTIDEPTDTTEDVDFS